MKGMNIDITQKKTLTEYFRNIYEQIHNNWNVESSLAFFGNGKTNEGTDESKAIKRYYIEPFDKRFWKIFLNFDSERNIESIVWFLDENECELLSLGDLKGLFGDFSFHNVIYDETTSLYFTPTDNECVQYLETHILEWVEKRKDGTLYYKQGKVNVEVDDNQKVTSVLFKIKNIP